MNLKGQNLRIFIDDGTKSKVIAKATNCVITYTGNTESARHKDVPGMAAHPVIVSKGFSVRVDSLDVTDASSMITAINSGRVFDLIWQETAVSDNQTPVASDELFQRHGKAYLTDATFQFDDRTNSTKNIQFSGTGAVDDLVDQTPSEVIPVSTTFTKGQYVRLFLGDTDVATPSAPIAAAKTLSLHISVQLQDSTTKDTEGDWVEQTPTEISYDISTSALMRSGETITSSVSAYTPGDMTDLFVAGNAFRWKIANVSGSNNRAAGAPIAGGLVIMTSLELNAPDAQGATYTATLQGVGAINITG